MRLPPLFRLLHGHRFAGVFSAPRRPRHPLLRVGLGLLGVALLLVLLVAGLFVGLAMLVAGVAWRLGSRRGQPIARARTIDGQFRPLHKPALPLPR